MKKVLLTAALGCALITNAFADGSPKTLAGTFDVVISDFITMSPSGSFNGGSHTFANPSEMISPYETGASTFTVSASRSWHATYQATDWTRTPASQNGNIANVVPIGAIFSIKTFNGTSGVTTFPTYAVATQGPSVIASQTTGTVTSTFDLNGQITPGLDHQMSGTYVTNITIIASLD